jgi:hypothetical protein
MAGKRTRRKTTRRERPKLSGPLTEAVDTRRAITTEVIARDGVPLDEPQVVVVVEPIRLPSGRALFFQAPFVVPFYLLKSKSLRDVAEPRREKAIAKTVEAEDGALRPRDPFNVLDALEDLALSVVMAAAAIEAHANDMIGRLPDDEMVDVPTRLGGKTVSVMRDKAAMDWMPMSDKLSRAVPLLHGTPSIKGTVAWQKYKRLFRLRNALVHPRRDAVNNPDLPSVFGKLLLGDGSSAPEDAASVIEALEPGHLPATIRDELGLPPAVRANEA